MLTIRPHDHSSRKPIELLTKGLDSNAAKKRGYNPVEEFGLFLWDDENQIVGGCNGLLYYGCIFIDQLWVDERFRGQGYGKKLIQAAEDLGKQKGCKFSTIETMDWEALDFYKKLGYYVELERGGYIDNVKMYCLRRNF